MITLKEIKQVINSLSSTCINELEFKRGTARLTIRRELPVSGCHPSEVLSEDAQQSAELPQGEELQRAIYAQQVGYFVSRPPAALKALVQPGDEVVPGQLVGLLRVGTLYQPVRATDTGCIGACVVEEQSLVEYGTPLFTLLD